MFYFKSMIRYLAAALSFTLIFSMILNSSVYAKGLNSMQAQIGADGGIYTITVSYTHLTLPTILRV